VRTFSENYTHLALSFQQTKYHKRFFTQ